jgi:hypothetical protein
MHFTLAVTAPFNEKEVYVFGAFNDFSISDNNKMNYSSKNQTYTTSILLKQGFYNYTFATLGSDNMVNTNEINGSFFQTENEYTVLVYYKPVGSLYDRVIGVGQGYFDQNR